jgi:hypothetical protein
MGAFTALLCVCVCVCVCVAQRPSQIFSFFFSHTPDVLGVFQSPLFNLFTESLADFR